MGRHRLAESFGVMKRTIRTVVVLAAGLVTWLLCFKIASEAEAQTGINVPVRVEQCRVIFRMLWFPFSWLPSPHVIGTWSGLRIVLICVPYGAAVGAGLWWLLRTRHSVRV